MAYMISRLVYNVDRQERVGPQRSVYADKSAPFVYFGNQHLWQIYLQDNDEVAVSLQAGEFAFYIDKDFTQNTPLISVANADINDTGDWSEADPAVGKIGVAINADDADLETYLSTSYEKTIYWSLWYKPTGASIWSAIATGPAYARNTVDYFEESSSENMSSGSSESTSSSTSSNSSSSSIDSPSSSSSTSTQSYSSSSTSSSIDSSSSSSSGV